MRLNEDCYGAKVSDLTVTISEDDFANFSVGSEVTINYDGKDHIRKVRDFPEDIGIVVKGYPIYYSDFNFISSEDLDDWYNSDKFNENEKDFHIFHRGDFDKYKISDEELENKLKEDHTNDKEKLEEGNKLKAAALAGLLMLGGLTNAEAKEAVQNDDVQTIESVKDNIKSINATEFNNLVKQMVVAAYGPSGLSDKIKVAQAEHLARKNLEKDNIDITYYKDRFDNMKENRKFRESDETFYDVFKNEDIDSLFNGNTDFKVAGRDLQFISGADQFATFKEDGFAGYEFALTTRDGSKQYEVEVQFYRDEPVDNIIIRDSNNEIVGEFALKQNCPAWAARNKIVAWLNGDKHYVENKSKKSIRESADLANLIAEVKDVRDNIPEDCDDAYDLVDDLNIWLASVDQEGLNREKSSELYDIADHYSESEISDVADEIFSICKDINETLYALNESKSRKTIKEDFEFYREPDGKIGVDKVVTTTSRSGLSYRDGTPNRSGDTSNVVKRVPFSKMSDDDKDLARAAYKTLKLNGDIDEVDKRFKTSPRPDVVVKGDGTHADIYYDNNRDGEPDEKNVRLVAGKRHSKWQSEHKMNESIEDDEYEFPAVAAEHPESFVAILKDYLPDGVEAELGEKDTDGYEVILHDTQAPKGYELIYLYISKDEDDDWSLVVADEDETTGIPKDCTWDKLSEWLVSVIWGK